MSTNHDLLLLCGGGIKVPASGDALMKASSNIAFKEIVAAAIKERQGEEKAVLRVPSDAHHSWSKCVALLHDPKDTFIDWASMLDLLKLADKYELRPVLAACEDRLVCDAFKKYNGRNPYTDVKLVGQVPWRQDDTEGSSQKCVEIARHLKSCCSTAAYKAFMTSWTTGMMSSRCGSDALPDYNPRLKKAIEILRGGTSAQDKEIMADMLYCFGSM